MKTYRYTVFFSRQLLGYSVSVPAMPELSTFGDTLESARIMAKLTIRDFINGARQRREAIPQNVEPIREEIEVSV